MDYDLNKLTISKAEEDALLQCSNFSEMFDKVLAQLEMDDYYGLTMQLRNIELVLYKLVVNERARIYSERLKTLTERLDAGQSKEGS